MASSNAVGDFTDEVNRLRGNALVALNAVIAEIITDTNRHRSEAPARCDSDDNQEERLRELANTLKLQYSPLAVEHMSPLEALAMEPVVKEKQMSPAGVTPTAASPESLEKPPEKLFRRISLSLSRRGSTSKNATSPSGTSAAVGAAGVAAGEAETMPNSPRLAMSRLLGPLTKNRPPSSLSGSPTASSQQVVGVGGGGSVGGGLARRSVTVNTYSASASSPLGVAAHRLSLGTPTSSTDRVLPSLETGPAAEGSTELAGLALSPASAQPAHPDQIIAVALAELCKALYNVQGMPSILPATPEASGEATATTTAMVATPPDKAGSDSGTAATSAPASDSIVHSPLTPASSESETEVADSATASAPPPVRPRESTTSSNRSTRLSVGGTTAETLAAWVEVDRLTSLVLCLIEQRRAATAAAVSSSPTTPPASSTPSPTTPMTPSSGTALLQGSRVENAERAIASPPELSMSTMSMVRPITELGEVVTAIERVVRTAPRMFNQTVTLTAQQERNMNAAQLTKLVDRLVAGKEEYATQRATFGATPMASGEQKLSALVESLMVAGARKLENQRVGMSEGAMKRMEEAKLVRLVARGAESRMSNQDWKSRETQLLEDLSVLCRNLAAPSKMSDQRFVMTPEKEKELFLKNVFGRLDRLEVRRMSNQEASSSRGSLTGTGVAASAAGALATAAAAVATAAPVAASH
ncbi:hypothetical protein DFJ73DRAFT_762618 [Zopfochytrium polystomum]|nr:hypothetical protein DFJ73DRAFT_762618 [Zopfochytrium polystomum]